MIDLLNPYRWLLALGLLLALALGYQAWAAHQQGIGEDRATARYNAAIAKQKVEAAGVLARETQRALDAERRMAAEREQREKQDAANNLTINDLRARLRAAAGNAGRLRDPNATPLRCGPGGGGAEGATAAATGDRAADGAQAGGLLSAQLTGLLQRLTEEADTVNAAYIACRQDAQSVRAAN